MNSSPTCPRIATRTEIDTELDRLEVQEEKIITDSEEARKIIDRRSNARPDIVLAGCTEG